MFKRLDIYVFKNFLTLFIGTFVISIFILMMQFLWKYIDDLVGKGLSVDVLGQFFFYAGETLVSLALPLAILLAALISFGNMGERLELLAAKAAGIPLVRIMRPIAVAMIGMTFVSYYFQDYAAPHAQKMLYQMLFSMRETSPTIDIPEGVFYDGIDGVNLYVSEKDDETNMLYEVIIYELTDGPENAHIILADSALLETSADKQHLVLHLYHGEQFENLKTNAMKTENMPYRRETFVTKHFIIDFNSDFSMTDNDFSHRAKTKQMAGLITGIDSLQHVIDSTALANYDDMKKGTLNVSGFTRLQFNFINRQSFKTNSYSRPMYDFDRFREHVEDSDGQDGVEGGNGDSTKTVVDSVAKRRQWVKDSIEYMKKKEEERKADMIEAKKMKKARAQMAHLNTDSLYEKISNGQKADVVHKALQKVSLASADMEFRVEEMKELRRELRQHEIQIWQKITLALACIIFFFIGAPLGAIIRKGGMGMPVVVAVVIFLFYYIINSFGNNLALAGKIPIWLGMWFSTLVLTPIAFYLTVKSNNDSVVFNIDTYRNFFRKVMGIRSKRNIYRKEVIIHDPDYDVLAGKVDAIIEKAKEYRRTKRLGGFPNYFKVFFVRGRDEDIEKLSVDMEECVEMMSNSKDRIILKYVNGFPIIDPYAHTAPFKNNTWNKVAGYVFPVGIVLLFRINRFRRRLRHDLKDIITNGKILSKQCHILAGHEVEEDNS